MAMTVEKYECILRSCLGNELKIISMNVEAATKPGFNFMSSIKRVKINYIENGKESSITFIAKHSLPDKKQCELLRSDDAFKNEIAAYNYVIPMLSKFTKSYLPFPKVIYAGAFDESSVVIMMEDLNESGFKMANTSQCLDFDRCAQILTQLARFHAASLVAKVFSPAKFKEACKRIDEIVYTDKTTNYYSNIMQMSLDEVNKILENDKTLGEAINCLKHFSGKSLFKTMRGLVENCSDEWKVLSHGCLWINDLMFRSNLEINDTPNIRLIDLKSVRYANPVLDLLTFFYTNTDFNLRNKSMDQLIAIYRETLIESLDENLYLTHKMEFLDLSEIFTVKNIKIEMEQRALYGFGMALWILPAMCLVHLESKNEMINTINKPGEHAEIMKFMLSNAYHDRVKEVVQEFYTRGLLEN